MNLKGINTYQDLQNLRAEMGESYCFKHKKGGWTIRRFSVAFNYESELPQKTTVFYESNNRRYDIKIKNLHKHFEIIEGE